MSLASYKFKVRYKGLVANENQLPLYDGSLSIHGVAQAMQIATHAYITQKPIHKATAAKGAKFFSAQIREEVL